MNGEIINSGFSYPDDAVLKDKVFFSVWQRQEPDSLYALAHINLGLLLLSRILEVSYDELIRNRKFQTRITIDQHKDSKVRQELYRANPYEKPRQDAGVFLLEFKLNFIL